MKTGLGKVQEEADKSPAKPGGLDLEATVAAMETKNKDVVNKGFRCFPVQILKSGKTTK
jgi:hypothetical protein